MAKCSRKRLPDFPDLPTAAESVGGFQALGWQVLVAPAGTPEAIVQKVNADLIKAAGDPEVQKRLAQFGRDARALTPAETAEFIQGEQRTWAPILAQIGQTK